MSEKVATMSNELAIVTARGKPGDGIITSKSYSIYDRNPLVPKLIKKGLKTLDEARVAANEYMRSNEGPVVVVEIASTHKIARLVERL